MENEKNGMCDVCGFHKGRYMWTRLILAVLIGLFIFLAGIQIGELRSEVYGGRMMRWHNEGGMMMDNSMMPGQDGSTRTIMIMPPANGTTPAAPAAATAPATHQ